MNYIQYTVTKCFNHFGVLAHPKLTSSEAHIRRIWGVYSPGQTTQVSHLQCRTSSNVEPPPPLQTSQVAYSLTYSLRSSSLMLMASEKTSKLHVAKILPPEVLTIAHPLEKSYTLWAYKKGKGKGTVQPLMEVFHGTATECHLTYGITQCYLLPDTSEHTPP